MNHKRFKIKSKESKLWFWVCVYEKQDDMLKDASKFDVARGQSAHRKGVVGLCQPYIREVYDVNGKKLEQRDNIGIIRLYREAASTEVVAHEVLHAAFWNYRVEHGKANFGGECNKKEEDIAYIYGQLFRDITCKLYKYKFWS